MTNLVEDQMASEITLECPLQSTFLCSSPGPQTHSHVLEELIDVVRLAWDIAEGKYAIPTSLWLQGF